MTTSEIIKWVKFQREQELTDIEIEIKFEKLVEENEII